MGNRKTVTGEWRLDKLPENYDVPRVPELEVSLLSGVLDSVKVKRSGSGYDTPTLTISQAGNTSFVGRVVIANGSVIRVDVVDGGVGYVDPETEGNFEFSYVFQDSTGVNASVVIDITVANIENGQIVFVPITNGGSGFIEPVTSVVDASGSGATVTSYFSDGGVEEIIVNSGGSGYSNTTTVAVVEPSSTTGEQYRLIWGTDGVKIDTDLHKMTFNSNSKTSDDLPNTPLDPDMDAGIFVKRDGNISSNEVSMHWDESQAVWNIVGDGSGKGRNTETDITSYVDVSSPVDTITTVFGGSGYDSAPTVTVEPIYDSVGLPVPVEQATATSVIDGVGTVSTLDTDGGVTGSGYALVKSVTVTGSGSGASAFASIDAVGEIEISEPGSGYTFATVTISEPISRDGSLNSLGRQAKAFVNSITSGGIEEIIVTDGGSGYFEAPIVTIDGDGVGAAAIGDVTGIGTITMDATGAGYSGLVEMVVNGVSSDGTENTSAKGIGVIDAVGTITVTDGGDFYTQTPQITIDNPVSGIPAVAISSLTQDPYRDIWIFSGSPEDFTSSQVSNNNRVKIQGLVYPNGDNGLSGQAIVTDGNGNLSIGNMDLASATRSDYVASVTPRDDDPGIPTIGNPEDPNTSVGLIFSGNPALGTNARVRLGVDNTVVRTFGTQSVFGDKTFVPETAIVIQGNLDVQGILTSIDEQTLFVTDNRVVLNSSLRDVDSPISGASGLQINRGGANDVAIAWAEGDIIDTSDTQEEGRWKILKGPVGDPATGTATIASAPGPITSLNVTDGGTQYADASPPSVFIRGDGTGAIATATVVGGAVTALNLVEGGTNYTFAQVIINPPPTTGLVSSDYLTLRVADSGENTSPALRTDPANNTFDAVVDNMSGFNADKLDGWHGRMYRDATNLNAGKLPSARFDNDSHGTRAALTDGVHSVGPNLYLHPIAVPDANASGNDANNSATIKAKSGFISPHSQFKLDSARYGAAPNQVVKRNSSGGIQITQRKIPDTQPNHTTSGQDFDEITLKVNAYDGLLALDDGLKHDATADTSSVTNVVDGNASAFAITEAARATSISFGADGGDGITSDGNGYLIHNMEFDKPNGSNTASPDYGHVTGLSLVNLDARYYTITQMDSLSNGFVPRDFIIGRGNGLTGGDITFQNRSRIDLHVAGAADSGIVANANDISIDETHRFHLDHETISVIGGNGLTGGGTIATNRTIHVAAAADSGIVVNANDIDIDETHRFHKNHDAISVVAGSGLTGGGNISATRTINVGAGSGITVAADTVSHGDTSSQGSVNNSNGTVIQDITLDGFGHITAIGSANLDGRYVNTTGNETMTGSLTAASFIGPLTGNADSATVADAWSSSITLNLIGDAAGSASFDGSSNASLSVIVVDDSHNHTNSAGDFTVNGSLDVRNTNVQLQLTDTTYDDKYWMLDHQGGDLFFRFNNTTTSSALTVTEEGITQGSFSGPLSGNASTASMWQTARTLTLTGGATGSVSIRGNGNMTMPVTVTGGDHNHNDLYYTESESNSRFVNVTGDTMTGVLTATEFIGDLTGNASTSSMWATARTLTLTGDVTGSVSIRGNAAMSMVTTVANDSHNHDSSYYTKTQADAKYALNSVSILAGNGLTGGGTLAANRTLNVVGGSGITANANDIAVDSTVIRTTGGQTISGTLGTTGNFVAGETSGGVGLTINDGHGNANVTFNHTAGVPYQTGSSGRIETAVDGTSAKMNFELADNVSAGVGVTLTSMLNLTTSGATFSREVTAPTFNTNSALKYKEEVMSFENALEKVMQIDVITYLGKGDETKKRRLGVTAESMSVAAPELVKFDEDGNPDAVNYAQTVALLAQAIQEQEKRRLSYRMKAAWNKVKGWFTRDS